MKIRSVLTASAIGSLIAAANVVPASAHDVEAIFDVYVRATAESEPTAESEDPDASESLPVEDNADDADEPASETPDAAVETVIPTAPNTETSDEPEPVAPDDSVAEIDVAPLIAPVELSPETSSAENSDEAIALPAQASAPESVQPLSQASAAEAVLPLIQESVAAAGNSSVQEPATGPDTSPVIGAGPEASILTVEEDPTQPGTEETQDIPPEPRKIDTVEIEQESSSPQSEDNQIEAGENPAVDEPLPVTGSSSGVLALGGALLLAAGLVLVSIRRRGSN